jgi:acetyl-CoA/propionyl-CoA carboxylase biotin carboxyl carrier protein
MKVLVANRGEIACRILRTLREMGVPSVALACDLEGDSPHLELATESVRIGPPERYLDIPTVLEAARRTGATAIHPGYGFLSQSAAFARAVREAGHVFVGPTAESMTAIGDKRGSRETALGLGIPVIPGAKEVDSLPVALEAAARLGYPVLLKAAGGGGGKGMRRIDAPAQLREAHEGARREARAAFGDDRLLLEKLIHPARHVEIQVLGDGTEAIALGERECSLQRRYQKIVEEAPALWLPAPTRAQMSEAARGMIRAARYQGAATVEFLIGSDGSFYFLEVNTRLQVEHPVTEMLTGLDLVRAQLEIAHGGSLPAAPPPRGHAIEARLNAENPYQDFLPQVGKILLLEWPHLPGVRVDGGLREGVEVTPRFDPLLAKLIAWGNDREQARRRLLEALRGTVLLGCGTNQTFLIDLVERDFFVRGETYTHSIESAQWKEPAVPGEVREAARRLLSEEAGPGDGAPGDRSPWSTLPGFRMGE